VSERKKKATGRSEAGRDSGGRSPVALGLLAVAALAGLVVAWNVVSGLTDRTVRTAVVLEDTSPQNLLRLATPVERGEAGTPIVIMDFSDYSCPACRQFAAAVKPFIDDPYVAQGLVRFQYFDFVTGQFPNSFLAARAARCAGDQEQYWAYHDQLFRTQDRWARQADPVGDLEEYAGQLGLNQGDFRSCLRSDRHAETVTANTLLARQLGVNATPTIFLNTGEGQGRRIEQWGSAQAIAALLDEAIERLGVGEVPDQEVPDTEVQPDPTTTGGTP
jgi:protein-disulfide isomerase